MNSIEHFAIQRRRDGMTVRKTGKRRILTRREFVRDSSRAGATVAGAALFPSLHPDAEARASSLIEGAEVLSVRGAVASEPMEVARAGARMLEMGGNAADAAAAACLVGCMIEPHLVDLGGYVCCGVVLDQKSGQVWSLDADSVAPAAAKERMYEVIPVRKGPAGINELEYACSVKDDANIYGPLAVAVPGTMAGIGLLWERWGALKWYDIVAPAREVLEKGFPYGSAADAIKLKEAPIRSLESSTKHLMPSGKLPEASDLWHRPDMQKTLARISSAGWKDFYEGELGRKIADHLSGTGGIITRNDMAAYQPRVTKAYEITYRAAKAYGAALPNGGLSTLQILNMLEYFTPGSDSLAAYWHLWAEIQKLAWRDRFRYLGDPGFSKVPIERLLSKDYAAGRTETIRQFPKHVDSLVPSVPNGPSKGTLHVSAADTKGNLVAVTISHGGFFGSCVTVPQTGITLGHGMCRFDPHPGTVNSVGPRKRPLNNVAPMIVRTQDRDVALGLRGGRRIVNVSAQLAHRIVDYGATGSEATGAPRIHVQAREPAEIADSVPAKLREELAAMGHQLKPVTDLVLGAHCAEFLKKQNKVRAGGNVAAAGVR
jgi:gamma-glutamyltranspeptidase/glutathione hydrolase